jgi:TrmH family RNA methyltransferase
MKNMELHDLWLVNPREFPHPEATARASGADDVLASARVVASLPEAIADCGLVLGTTARTREQHFRVLEARAAGVRMVAEAHSSPVAVLFGTERFGLSNEHLLTAHALLRIPANPAYESLNIAMAAQLIAYEIRMAQHQPGSAVPERESPLATGQQMECSNAPVADGRIRLPRSHANGTHLMGHIRRMFNRAELDGNEVNILRGILTSAEQAPAGRSGTDENGANPRHLRTTPPPPVDPRVARRMADARCHWHAAAVMAWPHALVETARAQVWPRHLSSGATESTASPSRHRAAGAAAWREMHFLTLATEHKSVLEPLRALQARRGGEHPHPAPMACSISVAGRRAATGNRAGVPAACEHRDWRGTGCSRAGRGLRRARRAAASGLLPECGQAAGCGA